MTKSKVRVIKSDEMTKAIGHGKIKVTKLDNTDRGFATDKGKK